MNGLPEQQEKAFVAYLAQCGKNQTEPSEHGFVVFYGIWCVMQGLRNDIGLEFNV